MTNRLAGQISPYLVQHAENPVHWWPWGAEAFEAARTSGKPVLLSVGYSACHWCHIMAHESFEDPGTAALMNELFVNIKVDREERPDVDHVYMQALHRLGEQGGWPLTMFLDADRRPFWGGTYFPKTAAYGRPSFRQVLRSVAEAYHGRRGDMDDNARAILAALAPADPEVQAPLSLTQIDAIAMRIRDVCDPVNGGLRGAPKFPNPPVLELLWRAADRTGDESIRAPVLTTLERMCLGGIFDHIGGGFARYSVDERWLVPHFEKMLYDNAQLLPLLALAATHTGKPVFRRAAERTVGWLLREMTTTSGAFAASQDADSLDDGGHVEEGAFYLWCPDEIAAVLGEAAGAFCAAFDITRAGNFEGRAIPNLLHRPGLTAEDLSAHDDAIDRLLAARTRRTPPARDDKVLADWNGLMIAGLARAAELLDRQDWLSAAQRAHAAVVDHLGGESMLGHAWRAGRAVRPGFASDHASMALAALTLHECTGEALYLDQASTWAETLIAYYRTEAGLYAMTTATAGDLPLRPAPTLDDAVPNANGIAAESFVRLFGLTGETAWRNAADALLEAATPAMRAQAFGHAALFNALDLRLRRADISVSADEKDALWLAARAIAYPNRTLALRSAAGQPHATVCTDGRCSLPIVYPEQLRARIEADLAPARVSS